LRKETGPYIPILREAKAESARLRLPLRCAEPSGRTGHLHPDS